MYVFGFLKLLNACGLLDRFVNKCVDIFVTELQPSNMQKKQIEFYVQVNNVYAKSWLCVVVEDMVYPNPS